MNLEKMAIGDAAAYIPGATQLFRRHNVEFCCHGNHPLKDVLESNPQLKSELLDLMEIGKDVPMISQADFKTIIAHILKTYHEKHRADLPEIIRLSERIESHHHDHPSCPKGLSAHLRFMAEELVLHMSKEENVLFPILANNPFAKPLAPIHVMTNEHVEHGKAIDKILELTNQLQLPADACTSWRALYANLDCFIQELKEHIHLENNVLFKRALQAEKE